ncbi:MULTISPECIES: type V toxin-antitoxin system endoribonuclease antitoxin GhoS [Leclercia]|uniref:Type V toxin-antitoxin system endoribonuclease antitoxin GhoS n=1 Tax=Leclercia pneumoniae TaxID=2815358 RepID=A0ABX8JNP6_9ENTR|nr:MULTISPECIES: type V toxin-antitoxin system endoribonuclease antitoxin GhoS [Leclercia]MBS0852831.1 type V toxin-antitoxin system endoribonuclease antitoxin GhoS [Enterobacter sp. JGM127]MCE6964232.1 type V toxin-antitoxin system endoribonuclease antitoxin GhoS [Enterobacter sp. MW07]MCV2512237.1 type V toxin-antitoxin system endoribonuclease antitoxin GhoS [Leclercia pneumoniae]MEB7499915.1 type V toxin-antitoxin system endoribonuclease antitoxin GhoS [Leclercia pneumoniae]QSW37145.1 type 
MSSGDITRYVVTVKVHEDSLTELNEINNHLTRSGFLLTLTDDEGNLHELGPNTFGLVSPLSPDEVEALAKGLVASATGKEATVEIATWDEWHKQQ